MKSIPLILLGTLCSAALTLHGQDAAPPSVDLYSGQKQPEATATAFPEPTAPDLPELSQLDEAFKKQTSLGKEADERRLHVEWRQLKNQIVNDPTVRASRAAAQAARTDLEKRNGLRNYYNIYFGRMSALASSVEMKLALESLKTAKLSLINQPRVRHETDGSLPTPMPSATASPGPGRKPGGKHKKHRKKDSRDQLATPPTVQLFYTRSIYGAFV
jgi:hypothetical protein